MRKATLLFVVLFCGLFLVVGYSQAATYNWTQVNQNGFGASTNYDTESMVVFDGKLYAGTYQDIGGTTSQAGDAEVWRTSNGTTWSQANTDGFGDSNNGRVTFMAVYGNKLYAGTDNPNGTEIWSTSNGTTWHQVNTNGFGDVHNGSSDAAVVFDGKLYALVYDGFNGYSEIWGTSNGITWSQVNSGGLGYTQGVSHTLTTFDGYLYAGLTETTSAGQALKVLRSQDGATWQQVNTDGFGDNNNVTINEMTVYRSKLYVATNKWNGSGYGTGTEIWRTDGTNDGTMWEQVGGDGLGLYDLALVSSMGVFDNHLIIGGTNYDSDDKTNTRVLSSGDGKIWDQINQDGFGDQNNYYPSNITSFNNKLYVDTYNPWTGTEVWRLDSSIQSNYTEVVEREKAAKTTTDTALTERLSGRILIQTEEEGEAWYVNPADKKKYYLGRPHNAFDIMRNTGLGITNANLDKIPVYGTSWAIDSSLAERVAGKILIQTEANGEAWYVSPVNLKRYYMGRPADAFQLMRNLGLGASNTDIRKIEVGE
ncbi:MAG: PQQ-like beta-propeller repeat protein [Parcubacteria group bacterium]|nr:PQQ-like beta-propeller repeat protein [Parcubacteria group bacterium]